ncbi:MAG: 4-(cytidine 5'-diphospho)-2-C-methyl-D-erythritol kinase [Anaerofustis stercorihominis]|nr:4-(cytidine 5'-diphospho)-2-C-methyl-D-erythritol kinase [Anaerofustis stercorihominis]
MMKYDSYAKINIGLDILNRRPDGYHNIRTYMQKISLKDVLTITRSSKTTIECTDPSVPTDERNLVYKAINIFSDAVGFNAGLNVHIDKKIPTQAGLGGGSSNAATTLIALDQLYETKLPKEKLERMALSIGADVPFFLCKEGGAMCEGIGEIISPLKKPAPIYSVVVIKPDFAISTKEAYEAIDNVGITSRPDFVEIFDGLYSSNPTKLKDHAINVFEEYAVKQYPEIEEIKSALYKMGAFSAFMTGSGSCIVGLFKKDPHLMLLGEKYRKTAMVERFINK